MDGACLIANKPGINYVQIQLRVVLYRREAWSLTLREPMVRPYEREQGFVEEIWIEEGRGKQVIG